MIEDRIKHFLTEKRVSAFRAFLAEDRARDFVDERLYRMRRLLLKDGGIECLFMAYLDKGRRQLAKEFMADIGHPISDGTFRARMIELVHLKLADALLTDPLKKYYEITELGRTIAILLLESFERLEQLGLL